VTRIPTAATTIRAVGSSSGSFRATDANDHSGIRNPDLRKLILSANEIDAAVSIGAIMPVHSILMGRYLSMILRCISGARLTVGGEIGGLAGNFTAWSLRARGSLPF
jgi:hypothetical protein